MNSLKYTESVASFIEKVNSNFAELATKWNCNVESFYMIKKGLSIKDIKEIFNHNFRQQIFTAAMSATEFIDKLNYAFQTYIWRFPQRIENITASGEASAVIANDKVNIVDDDSYVYSEDGINYSQPTPILWDGSSSAGGYCPRIVCIDNVYYMTCCSTDFTSLKLYTSTDFIHWTFVKTLMDANRQDSWRKTNYGNSFLFKNPDDNKYYLIYEAHNNLSSSVWRLGIAYCDTIDGDYTDFEDNPVVPYINPFSHDEGTGRPELACDSNNKVMKINGKFYLYYIYNNTNEGNAINRAWSYDLHHWVVEGSVLDVRVKCTPPATSYGNNGLFEFKGKTYMMYTADGDSGQPNMAHTDVTIDNRTMREILAINP